MNFSIEMDRVALEIGTMLAKMHDANICHGDLTTSNIIFRPNGSLVV